jgi:hypothetical protein
MDPLFHRRASSSSRGVNGPACALRRRHGSLPSLGLEHHHWDLPLGQVAVFVVSGIEPREFLPQCLLLFGVGAARVDGGAGAIGLDLSARVGLQIEPPGRRAVAAGVGGQNCEAAAVPQIATGVERLWPDLRPVVVRTRIGIPPVKMNERRIRPPLSRIAAACARVRAGAERRIEVR